MSVLPWRNRPHPPVPPRPRGSIERRLRRFVVVQEQRHLPRPDPANNPAITAMTHTARMRSLGRLRSILREISSKVPGNAKAFGGSVAR
jgi:hypothetical protein